MKTKLLLAVSLAIIPGIMFSASKVDPRKKLNSINSAKILAERNIVETVYGIKLKYTEQVDNFIDGTFQGTTETKTGKRKIVGIEFDEIKYDPDKDIAMVTASLKLSRIADLVDSTKFNLSKYPDKVIKRTAFATSTPVNAPKIAALRAAEIDAYKNLYKKIGGFTLESHTTVENFMLKSDQVKTSVIGALMGAEFMGFSWEGEGDDAIAVVKLRINMKDLSDMLGEKVVDFDREYLEAEGQAAQRIEGKDQVTEQPEAKQINKAEPIIGNVDVIP